ncbi:MAG: CPBP family intramembrane metalloprotease [Nevskiaceae bacterium]|jgi:membrane protease YdiL (CAAX protease family)|nr:CPBP family intramembrane metalloprotease [Nevskiaceae bacterium]
MHESQDFSHSPTRIFGAFAIALLTAMLVAAVLSPPVQWLLHAIWGTHERLQLHRIFNRIVELFALALLGWLMARLGLFRRGILGFERPWTLFARRVGIGLLVGITLMTLAAIPLFALDLRTWNPSRMPEGTLALLFFALKSIRIGLVIALVEETLFRGGMQGALEQQGARRAALFAIAALYAAVHFFGETTVVPDDQVTPLSGFVVLSGFFSLLRDPPHIWDAFIALYAVGVLLGLARRRTGGIATCIGLHAGFVAVITMLRRISIATPDERWGFLVGEFDGLLGLWIAAFAGGIFVLIWWAGRAGRKTQTAVNQPPEARNSNRSRRSDGAKNTKALPC